VVVDDAGKRCFECARDGRLLWVLDHDPLAAAVGVAPRVEAALRRLKDLEASV
jgi:hypothetical protein